ncbi:hypothetical protein NEUTE1DRAFT_115361 [Neurospora tetrasperma FGSC 2508]|uniref:Uncharacterized protein n=1 Tax=Neurospora tetrasperma (strain FGSC 2508 / ATCC MYA-4615 / P0657) TaxID=510951 RepID=F8N4N2_NEUT8|nr:uncharacterized protein NEUTE1DRAFT_115361 [Neurospora tetrasperma FGSC 2508]EGO53570.1 hypothetical protein NEUTE1DRAFT_115361 [Neurospora tetrasperma FGSC 2508]
MFEALRTTLYSDGIRDVGNQHYTLFAQPVQYTGFCVLHIPTVLLRQRDNRHSHNGLWESPVSGKQKGKKAGKKAAKAETRTRAHGQRMKGGHQKKIKGPR